MFAYFFFFGATACYIIASTKIVASQYGISDDSATTITAISSLINGLARIPWGMLVDKIGYRWSIFIGGALSFASMLAIDVCVKSVDDNAKATMFGVVWTICSIVTSGFYMVMCGIVPHYFGSTYADEIFGILNFAYAGCVIFLSIIKPGLENLEETHGQFLPFCFIGICGLIGGLTCLVLPAKPLPKLQAAEDSGLPFSMTGSRRPRISQAI